MKCKEEKCPRTAKVLGWCHMHYQRNISGADMSSPPKFPTPEKLLWVPGVLDQPISLTNDDRLYLAGFFDGEGCIGVYANGRKDGYNLSVQITQNKTKDSTPLLKLILKEFGGSLSDTSKKAWIYQCSGEKAVRFLKFLMPALRLKREQAQMAVDWHINRESINRNDEGRILPRSRNQFQIDREVSTELKRLKREVNG